MPYAMNQGVRIHYRVEGEGSPLVLQHGYTWNMDGWRQSGYVEPLKSHYRLVLLDARGHGASDKPHDPDAYRLPLKVGDVVAVLDALDLPSAHFWGYSMGGWIGWGMAKYAPERVQALIIGGAHPYERTTPAASRLDGSDPRAFVEALTRRLGFEFSTLPAAKQAEFLDNDFRALAADQLDRPPLDDMLPAMRMPCFLYGGAADSVTPRMQECVQHLPNASFVSFPGLNHPEAFWRGDVVLPAVMKFLHGVRDGRQLIV